MHILDTDHLSILDKDTLQRWTLERRLESIPSIDICVTIITYEEQMSGWLDYIAHANTMSRQIEAYGRLFNFVESFRTIRILEFDALAAAEFERLRRARIRIGTMDLKIAAIALANNAIPLTRNLSDFTRIPDLRAEGWSR